MSLFHLIAPSSRYIKQYAALHGIHHLAGEGRQVNNAEVTARHCECLAGTETERLEDLNSLVRLTTPSTIALAVRGGHGTDRLLADIDRQTPVARRQYDLLLICGRSDSIAIQCGLPTQGNVIVFGGSMLVANFGAGELNTFTEHHFWLALRNKTFAVEWQGESPTCQIEDTLQEGNFAMLISLIDTPRMSKIENGILVLEDISEHPLRVERMLLQLYHAGVLPHQKAIILGSFSGSTPNDYDAGYNLESVYVFLRSRLSILPITGLDFGHEQRTVTLSLGAHAILNNTREDTQLMISGHPILKV